MRLIWDFWCALYHVAISLIFFCVFRLMLACWPAKAWTRAYNSVRETQLLVLSICVQVIFGFIYIIQYKSSFDLYLKLKDHVYVSQHKILIPLTVFLLL